MNSSVKRLSNIPMCTTLCIPSQGCAHDGSRAAGKKESERRGGASAARRRPAGGAPHRRTRKRAPHGCHAGSHPVSYRVMQVYDPHALGEERKASTLSTQGAEGAGEKGGPLNKSKIQKKTGS